jgi:hypothetical protein
MADVAPLFPCETQRNPPRQGVTLADQDRIVEALVSAARLEGAIDKLGVQLSAIDRRIEQGLSSHREDLDRAVARIDKQNDRVEVIERNLAVERARMNLIIAVASSSVALAVSLGEKVVTALFLHHP